MYSPSGHIFDANDFHIWDMFEQICPINVPEKYDMFALWRHICLWHMYFSNLYSSCCSWLCFDTYLHQFMIYMYIKIGAV